ncbi:hypothetical protein FNV43_RR26814 [Rhamnella rubrinervis]|uniref:Uncharacterized protein n=1 Tax=Rhamnella rubrinervis TaxID=2594499 RepID=A0A8K0DQK7_9ROSA|nr:hypothetical protein FNV43_RR26814 [Rhamnella rubrinervis]
MDLKVLLKETACLGPSEQSKKKTIQLSGLDRMSPANLYTVFFYKSSDALDSKTSSSSSKAEDVVERAKRALQKVLVAWYPAAGRFRINKETGKLEIDCNDKGVTVVTAMTNSKLEELGGELHQYKLCYEKLVPQLPVADNVSDNPLLVVQITKFACGGVSIGLGGGHALFDGVGAFNFLASWAHICSGKDENDLLLPNHSREALLNAIDDSPKSGPTSSSISSSAANSIYEQEHIVAIQDLYGIPMQVVASDDRCWESALAIRLGGNDDSSQAAGLQHVTLSMKKEVVEEWKRLVVQRGKLSKCSTFDFLCAHLWKILEAGFNPHLVPTSGNAFVLGSVSCRASDVMEEPLHITIGRIQAAKELITGEYIRLFAKALESPDKFFPSMRELTIVTDWLKFGFHALDFGWGKVSSLALLASPVPEAAFLMVSLEEPGGFVVRIGVDDNHVSDFIDSFTNFDYPL